MFVNEDIKILMYSAAMIVHLEDGLKAAKYIHNTALDPTETRAQLGKLKSYLGDASHVIEMADLRAREIYSK